MFNFSSLIQLELRHWELRHLNEPVLRFRERRRPCLHRPRNASTAQQVVFKDTLEFPDNVHTNKQSGMVMAHSESCLQKEWYKKSGSVLTIHSTINKVVLVQTLPRLKLKSWKYCIYIFSISQDTLLIFSFSRNTITSIKVWVSGPWINKYAPHNMGFCTRSVNVIKGTASWVRFKMSAQR